jgi:phosphoglycolate phosphatase
MRSLPNGSDLSMESALNDVRGVVYDHDGTLIDSIELVVAATNTVLRDSAREQASRAAIMEGMVLPTRERLLLHAGSRDEKLGTELARKYYLAAWRIGTSAARPYRGVRELLCAVNARGMRQGMLSNNEGRIMRAHGLDAWIDPILGEEDVPAPKPAAEGLLAIAALWRLDPAEILLVGDSAADAGTAHAAGCPSIGVTWGAHPRGVIGKVGFDRLVDSPEELCALLAASGDGKTP